MTMTTTTSTLSRRGWLSRLLMAAVAPVVSVTMTETVDADKKDTKKQRREARIKKEVNQFRKDCSAGGGTFTVSKKPGGTTATCTGGDYAGEEGDGTSCTFHSKGTRCFLVRTDPTSPIAPGDGGSTPPNLLASGWRGHRTAATVLHAETARRELQHRRRVLQRRVQRPVLPA
jgi:hypothetical protein